MKNKIDNHFLGITDKDIAEHKKLFQRVRKLTNMMLKREINKTLNKL